MTSPCTCTSYHLNGSEITEDCGCNDYCPTCGAKWDNCQAQQEAQREEETEFQEGCIIC